MSVQTTSQPLANQGPLDPLLVRLSRLIVLPHSIFALPFAMSMAVLLWPVVSISSLQLVLLLVCIVAARSAAMGFNRVLDRHIDARNPRTASREIPSGQLSLGAGVAVVLAASAVFIAAAALLQPLCGLLALPVLAVLLGYSYCKRYTAAAHYVLGLALSLAPGGVWFALTGVWSLTPLWMMAGVLFWVAGFDVLYSCQDVEFDRKEHLHSVPSKVGVNGAFWISRFSHVAAITCFLVFGLVMNLGAFYFGGVGCFGLLLLSQHRLVSPTDLTNIDKAFFTRNGQASVVYLFGCILDVCLG